MKKFSLNKKNIKILLLEGLHKSSLDYFTKAGYSNIEYLTTALEEQELIKKIKDTHIIGIRSRTQLTEAVLKHASKLMSIGCFSIGTNQVNLQAAKLKGIPVFNAPFSNTRSVAELIIAECIMLMRGIPEKNSLAHQGKWMKSAKYSHEVRDKNLGIIGYGHIGSQVSILAESIGMKVYYYDIEKKLRYGNAKMCNSLNELLNISDIITIHVPSTEITKQLISEKEMSEMKKGSFLINASRGDVVDYNALCKYLEKNHIIGAAVDVFLEEPKSINDTFHSEMKKFNNVLLTPHIGGSTLEAQENIGLEVAEKLVKYSDVGSTIGSTNFTQLSLRPNEAAQRFLHIHENKPGVLREVNYIFTSKGINIAAEYLQTDTDIGYVIIDTESELKRNVLEELKNVPHTIKARMLY